MEITGKVVDQATGKPLTNVTIWEIAPDGQSAEVVGFSGNDGSYDVNINNAGSDVNFVTDGYQGLAYQHHRHYISPNIIGIG